MDKIGKIVFVTGPVKSGKSDFAVKYAIENFKEVIFIATAKPIDDEMRKRIEEHKKNRPKDWLTVEEGIDVEKVVEKLYGKFLIIDCITFWISNLIYENFDERKIIEKVEKLIKNIKKMIYQLLLFQMKWDGGLFQKIKWRGFLGI
jgi:adenosylcobinamide kinase/adenosylcobinamide-phosphate guanylyltransferase